MPLLIFSVGIAEPPAAHRAVYRRRIITWLIVGRHALTYALWVPSFHIFFYHLHTPRCDSRVSVNPEESVVFYRKILKIQGPGPSEVLSPD
jgi:hypothetical protein